MAEVASTVKTSTKKADKVSVKEKKQQKGQKNEKKKLVSSTDPSSSTTCTFTEEELLLKQSKFQHLVAVADNSSGQIVTPWLVETEDGVDYDKLINQFGCSRIDQTLIDRMEKLTGVKAHRYLRRGYFFSHRDLKELLDCYEKGIKFYLYTGRGPSSSSLHMGHLIPFTFTAWLQKAFNVPLVIQLTDDEKFLFKDNQLDEIMEMARQNAKDIIACGFDMDKIFIFTDTSYIQHLYPNILKIQKCVTYNQARGIFGFTGTDNIGKAAFPAVQAAPAFPTSFPIVLGGSPDWAESKEAKSIRCLIPQAIDQDPYFRMARDVAPRIGMQKPAVIHSKFFPALQGRSTKMSGSSTQATIFISDTPEDIAKKIKKYAFSGGGETKADHEKYGANLEIDIPYQYLTFMLEDDDELAKIASEYGSGRMMSGEVKQKLIDVMCDFAKDFQLKRSQVTDDIINEFMRVRHLKC